MKEKPVILVVDDYAKTVDLVKLTLSSNLECDILTASSGKAAVDVTLKHHPDIILLDITLPEMDGFNVCKAINGRKGFEDIPIIFLSGKAGNQDVVMGLNIGAVDFITKPFYPKELVARVQIHLKLRAQQQLIQRQNEQNNELLQVLCHDLMNPIGSLSGLLCLGEDHPEVLVDHRQLVSESVNNLMEMISLVRDLRAIDDGKIEIQLAPIYLRPAVENSLSILAHRMKEKEITTSISIPEEMTINAERTSFINSVLSNLITNAIKFSFPGSSIKITADELDEEYMTLTIEDNGIGIPPDLVPDLFSVNKATSRKGTLEESGTGYGLPLVKKFVTLYDGEISVFSVEKKAGLKHHGTKIILTLKRA